MKPMARHTLAVYVLALMALLSPITQASVIIHGTRVVYPADQQELVVRLENKGDRPTLVQAWLDKGDRQSTPQSVQTPFTLTPPIFRVEPNQQHALRLRYTGEPIPSDRESLYWLNVLEVPPSAADAAQKNQIQLSFRTRLRVFLRPAELPYPVERAAQKLLWKLVPHAQGFALQATNPTPYHVSLATVELSSAGKRYSKAPNKAVNDSLLAPGGDTKVFALPGLNARPSGTLKVEFTAVSDFGARVRHTASAAF